MQQQLKNVVAHAIAYDNKRPTLFVAMDKNVEQVLVSGKVTLCDQNQWIIILQLLSSPGYKLIRQSPCLKREAINVLYA